jgi:hypothetical protein
MAPSLEGVDRKQPGDEWEANLHALTVLIVNPGLRRTMARRLS